MEKIFCVLLIGAICLASYAPSASATDVVTDVVADVVTDVLAPNIGFFTALRTVLAGFGDISKIITLLGVLLYQVLSV